MKLDYVKKTLAIAIISAISINFLFAIDPIVVTVDNQKVTQSEFLRIYNKNNPQASFALKDLKDYMELFINYKLKVVEAEHLGFDTAASFQTEFQSYRDQLARPYLTDKEAEEKLLKETYDRLLYDVHVKHILFRATEYSPPKDTLAAYNRMMEALGKLKKGEQWDTIFNHYSEDRKAIDNFGDLNYCTALQLVYPFESAMYGFKPGEKYKTTRSKFGYHIICFIDKRPSKGEIKVQHIFIAFPENARKGEIDSAMLKTDTVYKKLLAGEKFEALAKQYSDDRRSVDKGGELDWFGTGQMIPEFEKVAYSIEKDSAYAKPFRSAFGFHIIRRIAIRPNSSFEETKEQIRNKIQRTDRANFAKNALIQKVKKEAPYVLNTKALNQLNTFIDSSIYDGTWNAEKAKALDNEWLFKLGSTSYTFKDFTAYLATCKYKKPSTIEMGTERYLKSYVDKKAIAYYDSKLEDKFPDLRYLLQEYHDGILLFNLMEQKIWTQAAKDTIGLEKYYNEHKDVYKWGDRVEALVVSSKVREIVDKAYKMAPDFNTGKIKADKIWKSICSDTTEACFNCQVTTFEKQDNRIIDSLGWEPGITPIVFIEGKYGFFVKKGTQPARPKTYEEAKGTVIADYQQLLEKNYLDDLRKKYKVVVDEKVLESMKKE
jgi:peptidyl-prolyl cis-trans isomerase SurA